MPEEKQDSEIARASLGEAWLRYPDEVRAAIENVESSRTILRALGLPGDIIGQDRPWTSQ